MFMPESILNLILGIGILAAVLLIGLVFFFLWHRATFKGDLKSTRNHLFFIVIFISSWAYFVTGDFNVRFYEPVKENQYWLLLFVFFVLPGILVRISKKREDFLSSYGQSQSGMFRAVYNFERLAVLGAAFADASLLFQRALDLIPGLF